MQMANLDQYLRGRRGVASVVARKAGVSAGTLSSIRSGQRRPSPDLAMRIEAATGGEVSASSLLGLGEAGYMRDLGDDRWVATVGESGSVILPAAVLARLDVGPGDRLLVRVQGDAIDVSSIKRNVAQAQDYVKSVVRPATSFADELIAERRADAAREAAKADSAG